MKPRTKREKRVMELHAKLPDITERQKQWAFDHCFKTDAFLYNGSVRCLRCGEVFEIETTDLCARLTAAEAVCPKCGRKLKLSVRARETRVLKELWYYTVITTFRGFLVCRHFIVEKNMKKHVSGIHYSINEAVQNWIDDSGNEVIVARPCNPSRFYNDVWKFRKKMSIQYAYKYNSDISEDKYKIDAEYIYPTRRVLPVIKRNGYRGKLHGICASELFKILLKDWRAEMLIKTRQFSLLRRLYIAGIPEDKIHCVRIANRAGYIVKDAVIWLDYLDLLDFFGKDTHNAVYVCPKNLQLAHDVLMMKKHEQEDWKKKARELANIAEKEKRYQEDKGRFFGISFSGHGIYVSVISSVQEMKEEGDAMHHCVYESSYYSKPDSLILSAKDGEGNRLETVEVNTKTWQVIQSRGAYNVSSERHEDIVSLVNNNINTIKTRNQ